MLSEAYYWEGNLSNAVLELIDAAVSGFVGLGLLTV